MGIDLLIENSRVFTGTSYEPQTTTIAISGNEIVAVGNDEVSELAGPETRRLDAQGGLVSPGFVDAHVHPIEGGLERMRCDLSAASTREGYLNLVARYVASVDDFWIIGGGWQMAAFPGGTPQASDLDAIVSDRPVYLPNRDHHGSWVNSKALELAGITRETLDPADGRIERDEFGNPSGTLHEGAAELVKKLIPRDTDQDRHAALLVAQKYLHSVGVTGWQDAIVGNYGGHTDTGDIYLAAAQSGELTARVELALWWDRHAGRDQLAALRQRREHLQHELVQARSIKIMQDGIPENQTAAMLEPYFVGGCPCAGQGSGISFLDPIELAAVVRELDADHWQVHIHAIGDKAVRDSLDAFAGLSRTGSVDNRHHIAHLQIVHPDDIARFAPLGVTATIQPLWATFEPQMVELNLPVLGDERASWQYPFGALHRAGAHLAAGSDWPVTTPNPWEGLHVAVNRTLRPSDADYTARQFFPEQALSLEIALAAYTSGSAWVNHDDAAGMLAPGTKADFVIANCNPFDNEPEEIGDTKAIATYVGGVEVFSI